MQGLTPAFIERQLAVSQLQGQTGAWVVFADLQGFTGYTERMLRKGKEGAEELSRLLDQVFGAAALAIHGRGGFIPHYAGDAFAGVFPGERYTAALEAAGAIHQAMESLGIAIPLRIGIGKGEVSWRISASTPHRWYLRGPGMAAAVHAQQQAGPGTICLATDLPPLPPGFAEEDAGACRRLTAWTLAMPVSAPEDPHPLADSFHADWLHGHLQGGEFRTVTAMFLSLSGDPGEERLMAWLEEACHRLERYRAYIKEMDFTDKGPLLVAFFGAPVSAGDSRRLALEAGLAVLDLPLSRAAGLHIGVATGPSFCGLAGNAFRRQYIVAGRSVNLAARLAMRGQAGQLLADPLTLEGLPVQVRSLGAFNAKGFADPVEIGLVEALSPAAGAEDLPYRPEALTAHLAATLTGSGRRMLQITGEPGMGKTFVARSLTRHTADRLVWLSVEGQRIRTGAFQALESAWETLDDPAIRPQVAADLGRIQAMRERLDLSPRERFANLERQHRQLLAREHLAVWVEHWEELDQDSRALLLDTADQGRIALLTTTRQAMPDWQDHRAAEHLLEGLDRVGMVALARRILGSPPAPALVDFLDRTTSGNPFHAGQLLLYLRDNRLLGEDTPEGVTLREGEISLGDSLRDILLARLDQLGPEVRQLLRIAAVIGSRFDTILLAEVVREAGESGIRVPEALSAALAADMLRPDGEEAFVFIHSLLREVLYDLQLASRLLHLHGCILRVMERRPVPDYRAMALHAARAEAIPQARQYYTLAARHALDAYQNREALQLYDEALRYTSAAEERAALLLERHPAAVALGRWPEALERLDDPAFSNPSAAARLPARDLARGQVLLLTGQYPQAEQHLREGYEGFDRRGDRDGMARCSRELSILHFRKGDYALAEEYIARTFGLLDDPKTGDPALVVNLALIRMNQGRYTEAEQLLYDELILRLQTGEQQILPVLYVNLGVVQNEMGHYTQALEHLGKGLAIAEASGSRLWMSIALGTRGMVWEHTGNWAQARADYEQDLELARELGDPQGTAIAEELLGSLLVREGAFDAGTRLLQQALDTCRRLGYRKGMVKCLLSLGEARLWQHDPEGARPLLEEARAAAETMGNRRLMALCALALAGMHLAQGQPEAARAWWTPVSEDVLSWEDPGLWRQWWALRLKMAGQEELPAILEETLRETADPWLLAEARRLRWATGRDPADREAALQGFRTDYAQRPMIMTRQRIEQLENHA